METPGAITGPPTGGPAAWVHHWALKCPEAPAVYFSDGRVENYAALWGRVGQLARWIQDAVTPGDVVAVLLPSWEDQLTWRLAAGAAGAVEALLAPELKGPERTARLKLLSAGLVVDRAVAEKATANLRDSLAAPHPLSPEDPCRILCTTGTTGTPRAVRFLTRHLDAAVASNLALRGYDSSDRLLAVLPQHHTTGAFNTDSVLAAGGAVAFGRRENIGWVTTALESHPITFMSIVPSMLGRLLASSRGREALSSLRRVNYGAERIDAHTLSRLCELFPGKISRGYGLTEAGPLVSVVDDRAHREGRAEAACIGRPIPGVEVRIDAEEGEPGELLVRSPHCMESYLGDPDASARTLRDGWLHTGDIARLENEQLWLVGRKGTRVRRGARWVHPEQAERALASLEGVEAVACVGAADSESLVAFLVVSPVFDPRTLTPHLRPLLARYKWPDRYEIVESLPKTATRKVDRKALSTRAAAAPGPQAMDRAGRPLVEAGSP